MIPLRSRKLCIAYRQNRTETGHFGCDMCIYIGSLCVHNVSLYYHIFNFTLCDYLMLLKLASDPIVIMQQHLLSIIPTTYSVCRSLFSMMETSPLTFIAFKVLLRTETGRKIELKLF